MSATQEGKPVVQRVDVKTGFGCNNRCRFCVQGNKRDHFGNRTTDEVKQVLSDARKDADSIVFTGGEVTIRKDFLELVRFAKELGFSTIQVQTNGRMLAYRKFCEETVAAGANEFSPALHGHVPELHDYLTNAPGAFKQTVQAIRNLHDLGQPVITNTVVTRSNYRHLVEIAKILVGLGVKQYQFAFVHPVGEVEVNFLSVTPRMTLIEPFVKKGLQVGLARGIVAVTEAIPFCFMHGFEQCVAERYIPRTKIFDARFVVEDYTEFRLTEGKAHGPRCIECTWFHLCEGPWREYPEKYGWDEFTPRRDPCFLEPEPCGCGEDGKTA
ncbi:MAG: radical SAM protein [Deltaproteobacteria bacterium]|nr:radical SAM protein [Deltaproteobacteria bacterium]